MRVTILLFALAAAPLPAQAPPEAATFPWTRDPLRPEEHPHWQEPRNQWRVFDFYTKQAEHFLRLPNVPSLLAEYPGLDGGKFGHWGNMGEGYPHDARWNEMDCGPFLSGVTLYANSRAAKGIFVRVGEKDDAGICFDTMTCKLVHAWKGGKWSIRDIRHGFMEGPEAKGESLPLPPESPKPGPVRYKGLYRHGTKVVFFYHDGKADKLESFGFDVGKITRMVEDAADGSLQSLTKGGQALWPQKLETKGTLGNGTPFAVDTLAIPEQNPWKTLFFLGDHDFLPNGAAAICTMTGDVWIISGIDDKLEKLTWKRFAAGLNQPLGLRVIDGKVHVQGKDQITRLHDLNGDGEADFFECVTNAYETSLGGHDYIAGLDHDGAGNFYTGSQNQGVMRVPANGGAVEVLATGLRNPDGLSWLPDGTLLTSAQEGDWTPSSQLIQVKPGGFYGYGGPRPNYGPNNQGYDPPLIYLPRGVDNSPGAFAMVDSPAWGPLNGLTLGTSFGTCSVYIVLRDESGAYPQGAIVPLPGEFLSGAHRLRFRKADGQLYVSGMDGWGTYAMRDGCFQRLRVAAPVQQLPVAWRVFENGVQITFSQLLDASVAGQAKSHFAQQWNYRYAANYGSPEFSAKYPGVPGHDLVEIASAHVLPDKKTLFLEMPQIIPVNALHLQVRSGSGPVHNLYGTVNQLGPAFTEFPGYRQIAKTVVIQGPAPWAKAQPNPWAMGERGRMVKVVAGIGLRYETAGISVKAGERISLVFENPDVVPHNLAIVQKNSLMLVGEAADKIITAPDGAQRQYVPDLKEVLAYTDITEAKRSATIHFTAPAEKGEYPYLCTFPGHWRVMNGVMVVE